MGVHSLNLRAAPLKMSLSVNVDGPALLGEVTALPLAVVSTGDGLDDAELVLTVKEGDKAGSTRENGGIRSVEASAPGPDVVLLRAPDSQSAMQPRESIAVGNVSAGGACGKVTCCGAGSDPRGRRGLPGVRLSRRRERRRGGAALETVRAERAGAVHVDAPGAVRVPHLRARSRRADVGGYRGARVGWGRDRVDRVGRRRRIDSRRGFGSSHERVQRRRRRDCEE